MTHPTFKAGRTDAGYTYITALVALVGMALAAQVTFIPTGTELRRAAETEMIFRGRSYARAITLYYEADPNAPSFPETLDDLLNDPRADGRRFMRRLYDPGIAAASWEELSAPQGGIMGVALSLPTPPFRQHQLPAGVELEDAPGGGTILRFLSAAAR